MMVVIETTNGRPRERWFAILIPTGNESDPDEVLRRLKAAGVEMRPGYEHLVLEYLISQSAGWQSEAG